METQETKKPRVAEMLTHPIRKDPEQLEAAKAEGCLVTRCKTCEACYYESATRAEKAYFKYCEETKWPFIRVRVWGERAHLAYSSETVMDWEERPSLQWLSDSRFEQVLHLISKDANPKIVAVPGMSFLGGRTVLTAVLTSPLNCSRCCPRS